MQRQRCYSVRNAAPGPAFPQLWNHIRVVTVKKLLGGWREIWQILQVDVNFETREDAVIGGKVA